MTQFRFMQAHSVGHFHSFRKRGQASFFSAKLSCICWKLSLSPFTVAVEDVKKEMQVRHYPERRAAELLSLLSTSLIFLSRENKRSAVCHCHCPFFHLHSIPCSISSLNAQQNAFRRKLPLSFGHSDISSIFISPFLVRWRYEMTQEFH